MVVWLSVVFGSEGGGAGGGGVGGGRGGALGISIS